MSVSYCEQLHRSQPCLNVATVNSLATEYSTVKDDLQAPTMTGDGCDILQSVSRQKTTSPGGLGGQNGQTDLPSTGHCMTSFTESGEHGFSDRRRSLS